MLLLGKLCNSLLNWWAQQYLHNQRPLSGFANFDRDLHEALNTILEFLRRTLPSAEAEHTSDIEMKEGTEGIASSSSSGSTTMHDVQGACMLEALHASPDSVNLQTLCIGIVAMFAEILRSGYLVIFLRSGEPSTTYSSTAHIFSPYFLPTST